MRIKQKKGGGGVPHSISGRARYFVHALAVLLNIHPQLAKFYRHANESSPAWTARGVLYLLFLVLASKIQEDRCDFSPTRI